MVTALSPGVLHTKRINTIMSLKAKRNSESFQMHEKPYIYGILRKPGMAWNFLDPLVANFVKL